MKWFVAVTAFTVASISVLKDSSEYGDKYPNILEDQGENFPFYDYQERFDDSITDEHAVDATKNEYWLYTKSNPTTPVILIPYDDENIKATVNLSKEIVVLVHGWTGSGSSPINKFLTKAFLEINDVNVIVLDWSHVGDHSYVTAKRGTPDVGKVLGAFIEKLCNLGASYDRMHIVGFSLGAHVVGWAGKATAGKIKRITGLDPAGPLWYIDKNRLKSGDAQYVEIIHTNAAGLGINLPCGDADFFPNGGKTMPGCSLNSCSHSKAYMYMMSSIIYNRFLAKECGSMKELNKDNCTGPVYHMGNADLNKTRSGIFRVNTGKEYPFWNTDE